MATVLGMHEIDLGEGADAAEFERMAAAVSSATAPSGMRVRVLKGERGSRAGQYLLILEMDSLDVRNLYFPVPDEDSEALLAFLGENPDAAQAWGALRSFEPTTDDPTDYVAIGD